MYANTEASYRHVDEIISVYDEVVVAKSRNSSLPRLDERRLPKFDSELMARYGAHKLTDPDAHYDLESFALSSSSKLNPFESFLLDLGVATDEWLVMPGGFPTGDSVTVLKPPTVNLRTHEPTSLTTHGIRPALNATVPAAPFPVVQFCVNSFEHVLPDEYVRLALGSFNDVIGRYVKAKDGKSEEFIVERTGKLGELIAERDAYVKEVLRCAVQLHSVQERVLRQVGRWMLAAKARRAGDAREGSDADERVSARLTSLGLEFTDLTGAWETVGCSADEAPALNCSFAVAKARLQDLWTLVASGVFNDSLVEPAMSPPTGEGIIRFGLELFKGLEEQGPSSLTRDVWVEIVEWACVYEHFQRRATIANAKRCTCELILSAFVYGGPIPSVDDLLFEADRFEREERRQEEGAPSDDADPAIEVMNAMALFLFDLGSGIQLYERNNRDPKLIEVNADGTFKRHTDERLVYYTDFKDIRAVAAHSGVTLREKWEAPWMESNAKKDSKAKRQLILNIAVGATGGCDLYSFRRRVKRWHQRIVERPLWMRPELVEGSEGADQRAWDSFEWWVALAEDWVSEVKRNGYANLP